jgi:hypothetical protein
LNCTLKLLKGKSGGCSIQLCLPEKIPSLFCPVRESLLFFKSANFLSPRLFLALSFLFCSKVEICSFPSFSPLNWYKLNFHFHHNFSRNYLFGRKYNFPLFIRRTAIIFLMKFLFLDQKLRHSADEYESHFGKYFFRIFKIDVSGGILGIVGDFHIFFSL